jgi:hypothetical protein
MRKGLIFKDFVGSPTILYTGNRIIRHHRQLIARSVGLRLSCVFYGRSSAPVREAAFGLKLAPFHVRYYGWRVRVVEVWAPANSLQRANHAIKVRLSRRMRTQNTKNAKDWILLSTA